MVAEDQSRRHSNFVRLLQGFNAPATEARYVKVDINWMVDGKAVMFDIKTPADFVASQRDGRLHEQMQHMQDSKAAIYGIYQTGKWYDGCGLSISAFDNEKARLMTEGAIIIECPENDDVSAAARLADFWRWTRDRMDKIAGYHAPVAMLPDNDHKKGLIFWDKDFRSKVGMIMHFPGVGPATANSLLEQHKLKDILGASEEGLNHAATNIWLPTQGIGKKTVDGFLRYMLS